MESKLNRRRFIQSGVEVAAGMWLMTAGCQDSNRHPASSPAVHPSRPASNWSGLSSISDKSRWARIQPADSENVWSPPPDREEPSRWEGILIHHSATDDGNAAVFHQAHILRGWDGLGYDFVIDNGRGGNDGNTEVGFRWRYQLTGAHCRPDPNDDNYWNEHTIGVCMVGDFDRYATPDYQWQSMLKLVRYLQDRYQISADRILGHRDVPGAKTTCPGRRVSLETIRADLG